jgi:hypothetical protein
MEWRRACFASVKVLSSNPNPTKKRKKLTHPKSTWFLSFSALWVIYNLPYCLSPKLGVIFDTLSLTAFGSTHWNSEMFIQARCGSTPVIPALRRLRQEDEKFRVSLGYKTKPCLKKTKQEMYVTLVTSIPTTTAKVGALSSLLPLHCLSPPSHSPEQFCFF